MNLKSQFFKKSIQKIKNNPYLYIFKDYKSEVYISIYTLHTHITYIYKKNVIDIYIYFIIIIYIYLKIILSFFKLQMTYTTLHILLSSIYMVFITVGLQKSGLTRKGLDLENGIIVIGCYLIRVIVMMSICGYDVF